MRKNAKKLLTSKTVSRVLFLLSSQANPKFGILYKLDAKTHEEISRFILPISALEGSLIQSDVFYDNYWHTLLVLTAMDPKQKKSLVLVFDVTDPTGPLSPFLSYNQNDLSMITTKPVIARLQNGRFGIVIGGHLRESAVLHIIWLTDPNLPTHFALNAKSLTMLSAVDIHQQAVVDKIYASDSEHLWALDMNALDDLQLRLLADIKGLHCLIVVSNVQREGVRLYFLGSRVFSSGVSSGLFMIEDPVERSAFVQVPILIREGSYVALFVRFGQLWAVLKQMWQAPLLLALPSHQPLSIKQQTLYTSDLLEEEAYLGKLIWDPKERREFLLTLNLSCQLNISALQADKNRNGRVMWRKLKR